MQAQSALIPVRNPDRPQGGTSGSPDLDPRAMRESRRSLSPDLESASVRQRRHEQHHRRWFGAPNSLDDLVALLGEGDVGARAAP